MISLSQADLQILKQKNTALYLKIQILSIESGQYKVDDEISGSLMDLSIDVDADSDLRRSCNLTLIAVDDKFNAESGSNVWLDKYIKILVGYNNILTGEIQWYNQGIFMVNAPSWTYDATTNSLSLQGLDLMAKMTGLRNGYLPGVPTLIPEGSNVRDAIIATIKLAGIEQYVVEECKNVDGVIQEVPYDIQIDRGGTLYNLLEELRDILPNYQVYFDIDGIFHYEPIPADEDEPITMTDSILQDVLIGEDVNTDFESVKNVIEVYGRTNEVDYYCETPEIKSIRYEGANVNVLTLPNFAGPEAYDYNETLGFIAPSGSGNFEFVSMNANGSQPKSLADPNGTIIRSLSEGEYYVIQFRYEEPPYILLGHDQVYAIAKDLNVNSPFYVYGSIGEIRKVCYGGEYDNIINDDLALQRANIELYWATRLNDSITLSTLPIPWLDVNILFTHTARGQEEKKYLIKSFSVTYSDSVSMNINAITFYPYYTTSNSNQYIYLDITTMYEKTPIQVLDTGGVLVAFGTTENYKLNLQLPNTGNYYVRYLNQSELWAYRQIVVDKPGTYTLDLS
jgi:hypothetical protein